MSISRFALMLTASLVASESLGQQTDPELAKGIRLVEQGEYSQAIIVLDTASRRLDRRPQDKGLAAQAYLYLGIAHLGEGQETLARASFREALTRAPGLSLSAFDVSPKVREAFQQAKDELAQRTAQAGPAKKGKSKAPLILLGVAAVGGGVAAAAGGGGAGSGPAGSGEARFDPRILFPEAPALAIVGVEVNFSCGDCDNSISGYTWDFGDGTTGTGRNVRHVYSSEGTFTVVVTASINGRALRSTLSITVRSLAATWDGLGGDGQRFVMRLAQSGGLLSGDVDGTRFTGQFLASGRDITLTPSCGGGISARINDTVTSMTGIGTLPCRRDPVQQTLTRR